MADYMRFFKLLNNSSENFVSSASNLVALYKGSSSYTGNVAASPDMAYYGAGIWGINIDDGDSGVFVVKKSTDGGSTYTTVEGLENVPVIMKDMLLLAGGTMQGDIDMGSNGLLNVDSISFNNASGNLHGIEVGNLLDKSATETVAGAFTFSGDNTVTGTIDFDAPENLKIGGVALNASLTASDINMLADLYSAGGKVVTTNKGWGGVASAESASIALTYDKCGLVEFNVAGGNVQATLPALAKENVGALFIISITSAGNTLSVKPNGADAGYSLMTGASTIVGASVISMDSTDDVVILMCTGKSGGTWAVLGAYGNTEIS
jgi:hypothetical protein